MKHPIELKIRAARAGDDAFILGLVSRFVAFELPPWRDREESADGVRRDIERHLRERPEGSYLFVAETGSGALAGFLHLLATLDFFTSAPNCHISDLAVAPDLDGLGIGSRLLAFAERWAKQHSCRHITLGVFPGNTRARSLYERHGYGVELLRMAKPVASRRFSNSKDFGLCCAAPAAGGRFCADETVPRQRMAGPGPWTESESWRSACLRKYELPAISIAPAACPWTPPGASSTG
jgi:ribosomal protein S18 acetylase RimI-like enzyme